MVLLSAALLALLESFMSILVIDLAGFGVREGFVCFCYLDELLLGSFVASVRTVSECSNLLSG